MIRLLMNEIWKLKKSSFVLSLLIVPLFAVIFGSINYYMNSAMLKHEWVSLWAQVYMIYGLIFLPVLIGIIVSFIWQVEHKQSAFKILLTSPVSKHLIITSKLVVSTLVVFLSQVYFFLLYYISGKFFHFHSNFPILLLGYLILITLLTIPLIALQGYLSIKLNSFALPVGLSLVFSIIALIATAQSKIPFLHYVFAAGKLTIAMNRYPEITLSFNEYVIMLLFSTASFLCFYCLQIVALKRKFK